MKLYRSMRVDNDALPEAGRSGRTLGVRIDLDDPDILFDEEGMVEPGTEGMSVCTAIEHLEPHRRPPEHGGDGKDPVWLIDEEALPDSLVYRADDEDPERHGYVEPAWRMSLDDYEDQLADTRHDWHICP